MIVIYPFTLTRRQDVKMHGCKKEKKKIVSLTLVILICSFREQIV